jgi:hypothetical protein
VIFELVELAGISGVMAKVYSIIDLSNNASNNNTLYDEFLVKYYSSYKIEIEDIEDALRTMGSETGLRSNRIIPFEGENYGDGISAICNRPNKILRLYSILYGDYLAIIGGGCEKPGSGALKKFDDCNTSQKNIKKVKNILDLAEEMGDIEISPTGIKSNNSLIFNSKDYE